MKLQYGQTHVEVVVDGSLVRAVVEGDIRRAHAQRILSAARNWSPDRLVQLVDYSAARIAIKADQLFEAAVQTNSPGEPTALVVPREAWSVFQTYAQLSAGRGALKGVFLTREAAERWVAEERAVREYWNRAANVHGSSR